MIKLDMFGQRGKRMIENYWNIIYKFTDGTAEDLGSKSEVTHLLSDLDKSNRFPLILGSKIIFHLLCVLNETRGVVGLE